MSLMTQRRTEREDKDIIRNVSGGSALHGLCIGISSNVLSQLAPHSVLKEPNCSQLLQPSLPAQIRTEYFKTTEEGNAFSKAISENGYTFGFDLKAKGFGFNASANYDREKKNKTTNTDYSEQKSTTITMSDFHFYPMASYLFNVNGFELSADAVESLRNVKDTSSAEKFLKKYGSHFPSGLHHVGGVLIHSVEIRSTKQMGKSDLERIAKDEMKAEASIGFRSVVNARVRNASANSNQQEFRSSSRSSNVSCRFQFDIRGPNNTDPKEFEKQLPGDSSTWHIIDRGDIFKSLIPIWEIVYDNHVELRKEADLLCNAWFNRSSSIGFDEVEAERLKVVQWKKSCWQQAIEQNIELQKHITSQTKLTERLKVEEAKKSSQQQAIKQSIELQKKITDQIKLLGDVNLEKIEPGEFMELLQRYYELMTELESSGTDRQSVNDPWVNYLAKQPEMRRLLMRLAEKNYRNKFVVVYNYLSSVITEDRRQKMEHAYYKLDDKICAMLARGDSPSSSQTPSTARTTDYIPNGNVVDVLSAELQHYSDRLDICKKRMEQILSNFLKETTQADYEFRNEVYDLLLADYNWDEGKLESVLDVDHCKCLIQNIRQLQQEKANELKYVKYPEIQQPQPDSIGAMYDKKPYAAILIDRPFDIAAVKGEKNQQTNHLMICLRHRLDFPQFGNTNSGNSGAAKQVARSAPRKIIKRSVATTASRNECSLKVSLYDTLLLLIDEFDATGAVEIFRLLLERRSAIPLFVPKSMEHHLDLLRHISLSNFEGFPMGEDESLVRVAMISCREKSQSQSSELLKNLFHIDSVHYHDIKNRSITSEKLMAEIGYGCLRVDEKVNNLLVIHVIGNFLPLWPFIVRFADYVLVEDSSSEDFSFDPDFINRNPRIKSDIARIGASKREEEIPYVCVWKPSTQTPDDEISHVIDEDTPGFGYCFLEGQFGSATIDILEKQFFAAALKECKRKKRCRLYEIPMLEGDGYGPLVCSMPFDIKAAIIADGAPNLGQVKKNNLTLQNIYEGQAEYEKNLWRQRIEKKKKIEEACIRRCCRQRQIRAHQTPLHPLLRLLLDLLTNQDPSVRFLAVRKFDKALADRNNQELGRQLQIVKDLYDEYRKQSAKSNGQEDELLKNIGKRLNEARTDLNESVLNIEHLWRELSHYYTAMKPGHLPPLIAKIPQLAAQHLLDGFSIELLDGDSNRLHLDWVKQVLRELEKLIGKPNGERIFVLSVMGVQSSGKSTLLNTMFGIQMRTSVGQCTRGVNMQLLKVEGRPEYDYILLLDTEGTRAPEYHGLEGSEERDNQMATLSILLADATIVTINGENVSAIQDILPIVLLAYKDSQLAQQNGGRKSSQMFFVFNRINMAQKEKLSNIIMNLGTSLDVAFRQARNIHSSGSHAEGLIGHSDQLQPDRSDTPFRNFKLKAPGSSCLTGDESDDTDVCILGNVTVTTEPPNDVPDAAFGKSLLVFRERIHRRVTEDGNWQSRSIDEFIKYMGLVWQCICSANFRLTFASIVECITLDKMDYEYKMIEKDLTEAYSKQYEAIKNQMIRDNVPEGNQQTRGDDDSRFQNYKTQLSQHIAVNVIAALNERVAVMVKGQGRSKWQTQYNKKWEAYKEDQEKNWESNLKMSFTSIFHFGYHVDEYKKVMRARFNDLFRRPGSTEQTEAQKRESFQSIYKEILQAAEDKFPGMKVFDVIEEVYAKDNIILSLPNDSGKNDKSHVEICKEFMRTARQRIRQDAESTQATSEAAIWDRIWQSVTDWFHKIIGATNEKLNKNILMAFKSVYDAVNRIVAGKVCYDESIITSVVLKTNGFISGNMKGSEKQLIHTFGRVLITELMEDIQKKWEAVNSVSGKLKQPENEKELRNYFDLVSRGYKKTQLFANHMASILKVNVAEAFYQHVQRNVVSRIISENKRWLYDARFMHKHMDLFLSDFLIKADVEIDKVLDYIRNPQMLYGQVLVQLITKELPKNVPQLWAEFTKHLKTAIITAANVAKTMKSGKAEKFVTQLKSAMLDDHNICSSWLAEKFTINIGGEFKDCDDEEDEEFGGACKRILVEAIPANLAILTHPDFAKILSGKVIEDLKTKDNPSTRPRCDFSCRICKSLCMKPANHDPETDKHDAIHQPGGAAGVWCYPTYELTASSCSQYYDNDGSFYMDGNYDVTYKYKDFAKVFSGWSNPRTHEEMPLREYILAKYNEYIAKKYEVKPCKFIPPGYRARNLECIRRDLKRDIGND